MAHSAFSLVLPSFATAPIACPTGRAFGVMKHIYKIHVTDTFGGEANYSWVIRKELTVSDGLSDLALVRRAKKLFGWSGYPCKSESYGDSITVRPRNDCQVMFIDYEATV